MLKLRHILAILAILLTGVHASGRFRYYTTEDGLPSNVVKSIYQDSEGYIYIGTENGICRYDSRTFTKYRSGKTGTSNISIFAMAEPGKPGVLWAGTRFGIHEITSKSDTLSKVRIEIDGIDCSDNMVFSMHKDKSGNIWAGTYCNGVYRYSPEEEKWYGYTEIFNDKIVYDIISRGNVVWAVCYDGNIYRYNSLSDEFIAIPLIDKFTRRQIEQASCCCFDSFGDIWICSAKGDLFKLDLATMQCTATFYDGVDSGMSVRKIIEYSPGMLFLGTNSGLISFDYYKKKYGYISQGTRKSDSDLNDRFIHELYIDSDGGLWVGTYFGGVNYYSSRIDIITTTVPPRDCGQIISAMCELEEGKVLVGSDDGGLSLFNVYDDSYRKVRIGSDNLNIHSILAEDNVVWVGTYESGLYLLDRNLNVRRKYTAYDVDKGDMNVYSIFRDSRGSLWIGTKDGICAYDKATDKFIRRVRLDKYSDIVSVCEHEGKIYFASYGSGLIIYDMDKDSFSRFVGDHIECPMNVTAISRFEGMLYLGSTEGLFVLNDSLKLEKRDIRAGNTNIILAMVGDNSGLWISTDGGLVCYTGSDQSATFDAEDGLLNNSLTYNSMIKLSNGEILLGCNGGINSFRGENLKNSVKPRKIPSVISKFCQITSESGKIVTENPERISISARRACFAIEFVSLDFKSSDKNVYSYRLAGYDKGWKIIRRDRNPGEVIYNNVKPGIYRFQICARQSQHDNPGDISELTIIVKRPFWQIMLTVFVIMAILTAMYLSFKVYQKYQERGRAIEEAESRLKSLILQGGTDIDGAGGRVTEKMKASLGIDVRKSAFCERVCKFIEDHLANPDLSINDILAETNVSRATLFNKVKADLNTTPNVLIRKIRLRRTLDLLATPGLRIKEICYETGFSSTSYFSKLFKNTFGITPKEYQDKIQ